MRSRLNAGALAAVLLLGATSAHAGTPPSVDPSGTVHAQSVTVPLSDMLSPEARKALAERMTHPPKMDGDGDFVTRARNGAKAVAAPIVERWKKIYPARIERSIMNGVAVDTITPTSGIAPENRNRVLIVLHGGGFFTGGAGLGGQLEGLPMAGVARIKVVAVDYRLTPENKFPAASEDVEQVYRALLRHYKPENIGIFGCSAGGTLTAQAVVRLQAHNLPRPGAIGVFCSGIMPGFWYGGDSQAITPTMNGSAPIASQEVPDNPYGLRLSAADRANPEAVPGVSREVMSRFPPTMLISGTRDIALSNVLVSNLKLKEAGVITELLVLEGLGHCDFTLLPDAPEAIQTHKIVWRFFDHYLGR